MFPLLPDHKAESADENANEREPGLGFEAEKPGRFVIVVILVFVSLRFCFIGHGITQF
jgi:hypothetical protein